jgi:hypothetical protein
MVTLVTSYIPVERGVINSLIYGHFLPQSLFFSPAPGAGKTAVMMHGGPPVLGDRGEFFRNVPKKRDTIVKFCLNKTSLTARW